MDYIGIIIFIIVVVVNVLSAVGGKKKKKSFPPRPTNTGAPGSPDAIPQTFEDLIRQAQEKARRIQEEKEYGSSKGPAAPATRQDIPVKQAPGKARLPERRVLVDENTYNPTVAKAPASAERARSLERKKEVVKKQLDKKPKPRLVKKPKARISGTIDKSGSNRIQAPENDFFADNEIGDISELEAGKKHKRKSSAIKRKLTAPGEFDFNLRDAVIYSEIMKRKF